VTAFTSLPASAATKSKSSAFKIRPGDKIGQWTILGYARDSRSRIHYDAVCSCGTKRRVRAYNLGHGESDSCGCVRDAVSRSRRMPNNAAAINVLVGVYQRSAAKRGIEWALDREDVDRLVRLPCHYCGDPGSNVQRSTERYIFLCNGIDRVDSTRGYYRDNVVPSCGQCNRCKGSLPQAEFIAWAHRVARRHKNGGDQ
jgi:5-methylcytosine-specific restriction endonuclease McrA